MNKKQSDPVRTKALAACRAVLLWAKKPCDHGANPYFYDFVKAAEIAVSAADHRQPESWAGGRRTE